MEAFKKGQIVPKRLKLALANIAKAQHGITFGADVEVSGKVITLKGDGSAIHVNHMSRPRKNGTRQKAALLMEGICVIPPGVQ